MPDVFTAKGKSKGFKTSHFVGNRTRQNDQIGPRDFVAVFLFDRPQKTTALIGIDVIGPGVQRGKALVASTATTTAIGKAIGACGVPRNAGKHADIAAPIGGPPILAFGHQRAEIVFNRLNVELFDFFGVIEIFAERINLGVMLVQDVKIQRIGPPIGHRGAQGGLTAMHDRTFPC